MAEIVNAMAQMAYGDLPYRGTLWRGVHRELVVGNGGSQLEVPVSALMAGRGAPSLPT